MLAKKHNNLKEQWNQLLKEKKYINVSEIAGRNVK